MGATYVIFNFLADVLKKVPVTLTYILINPVY